jgi:hypothetical protein
MLCRHNKWVQNFGQLKDPKEISRRERVWWDFVLGLEERFAKPAGALTSEEFRAALESSLDTEAFALKTASEVES